MLTIFQEEMKYKNNIVFQFEGNEYFLFQILNFGNKTDELKFIFNDGKFNTAIIYNKDTGIQNLMMYCNLRIDLPFRWKFLL